MQLIRAATLCVSDLARAQEAYTRWLDYRSVESGAVTQTQAENWNATNLTGQPYVLLAPASGRTSYLRLIEQPATPDYRPLRHYGWAAVEICIEDTLTLHEKLKASPFDIIGPPKPLDGMDTIFPMQVRGLDGEMLYLTQIRGDLPGHSLPRAQSFVDHPFILVMACQDMEASGAWLTETLHLDKGESLALTYSMINKTFDLPADTLHRIATLSHETDICIEIDQYPDTASPMPRSTGWLPPAFSMASFIHPDFAALIARTGATNYTSPSALYGGKRACILTSPDGALIELLEA